jgi:mannosyltransferase
VAVVVLALRIRWLATMHEAATPRGARIAWGRHAWLLGAVVLVAVLLRFPTVASQSYWADEFLTVTLLKRGLAEMLAAIPTQEGMPPLYYLLAWFWTKPFGTGEAALRSLSALFGVATVPVAYMAARDLVRSQRAGLLTAALVAVNPLLVWYSQEARSYALLVLLTALSFWFFVRALDGARTSSLAGWAISSALALATHYFAVFPIGVEAIWLVVRARGRRRSAVVSAGAVAAAGAALVPMVAFQIRQPGYDFIVQSDLAGRLAAVPHQFLFGFTAPGIAPRITGAVAVGLALALLALRATPTERRAAGIAAAIALAGVIVPLILALGGIDRLLTRYLLAALVPAAVALAIPLGARRAGAMGLLGASALCAVSLAAVATELTSPAVRKIDWRGAAQALGSPMQARVVVSTSRSRPLLFYLPGSRRLKPRKEVAAEEVDLIRVTPPPGQGGCWSGTACNVPSSTMLTDVAPPGFTLIEHRRLDQLTIIRLRQERSSPIKTSTLIRRLARPAFRRSPRLLNGVLAYFQPGLG